tara:strand:+ start:3126 stop:3314 length:189 start_codon:yes stop_codon:yes gene_type:complete
MPTLKPLDEMIPTYRRTAEVILPPKTNKDIKPQEIFEGLKKTSKPRAKKMPSKKVPKGTKKS